MTQIFHAIPEDQLRSALTEAALKVGLTGAAEYMRIAAVYLVEHQALPAEFVGRRAAIRTGRPQKAKAATEAA